ncbi:MAG: TolC family protein [Clostridium sp.]
MRRKNQILALGLAAVLTAASAVPAFAGYAPTGPGAEPEPEKYDAATLSKLQDNVLEYDELALRVREYNPNISEAWRKYGESKEDYQNMLTELESTYDDSMDNIDAVLKPLKQAEKLMPQLKGTVKQMSSLKSGYHSLVQGIRDTVTNWDTSKRNTSQIRQYEKQVISGAQSAMIGYNTIVDNKATLETMVDLYQKQCDMYQRMAALGLANQTDVVSAQTSLIGAKSQLASLQSQEDSVYRTLCLLLGYDTDSGVEIRNLPDFDMSRLDGMNLEADTKKAIGNNYTLIGQRTSAKGETNAQIAARLNTIEEGEQKLTIEMQRLYQDVLDKKAAYEAAMTGYEAAEKSNGAAQRQYQNGLLSEMQYVGTQISYNQKKAAKESAELDLWTAMNAYDWGIEGLAAVE